jgi:hypothetical protein
MMRVLAVWRWSAVAAALTLCACSGGRADRDDAAASSTFGRSQSGFGERMRLPLRADYGWWVAPWCQTPITGTSPR